MSLDKENMEKKVKKLSRKTNLAIMRREISYDNKIKDLDSKIQEFSKDNIDGFDDQIKSHYKILSANFKDPSIDLYRNKLNDI